VLIKGSLTGQGRGSWWLAGKIFHSKHTPDQQRQEEQVQAGSPEQEGETGFQFFPFTKRIGKPLSDAFIWGKGRLLKIKIVPPMLSSCQHLGLVTER